MIQQKHWLTCLRNSWVFRLPCRTWLRQCHWMLYCQTRLFWCTTSWCSYVRLPCRTSGQSQQLFLWCKNSYYYGIRTVIIMVQEQLLLWYKNSYYCDARTTVVISPLFLLSWTYLWHFFRIFFALFFALLDTFWKKIAVMDTYGHLWTVMDTLAFCDFVSLLCVKWGIWGPCSPISITTLITNSQYVGTNGRTRITWYRQLKINYIKTITI